MKNVIIILIVLLANSASAQKHIDLHLRINDGKSVSIFNDELIRATLTVSLPYSEGASRANRNIDGLIIQLSDSLNQELISPAYFESHRDTLLSRKQKEEVVDIKHLSELWSSDFKLITTIQGNEVSYFNLSNCDLSDLESDQLSAQNKLYLNFWIEKTVDFAPGNFNILLEYKDFESNSCRLSIKHENVPRATSQSEAYLLDQAFHYFVCNDGDNLMHFANEILAINDQSIAGYTYLADAQFLNDDRAEALVNYKKALELFYEQYPDEYELPMILISNISMLEDEDE